LAEIRGLAAALDEAVKLDLGQFAVVDFAGEGLKGRIEARREAAEVEGHRSDSRERQANAERIAG
jgi:hypothetical protein